MEGQELCFHPSQCRVTKQVLARRRKPGHVVALEIMKAYVGNNGQETDTFLCTRDRITVISLHSSLRVLGTLSPIKSQGDTRVAIQLLPVLAGVEFEGEAM